MMCPHPHMDTPHTCGHTHTDTDKHTDISQDEEEGELGKDGRDKEDEKGKREEGREGGRGGRGGSGRRKYMLTHQFDEVAKIPLHCLWGQPPHQVQGAVQLVIRVRLETTAEAVAKKRRRVERYDGAQKKKNGER